MTVPLSDARLTEIRERVPSAVRLAANPAEVDKGHVWVTGSLSGSDRCSACHLSQRALESDEVVLLAELDRLRDQVADLERTVTYFDEQSKRRKEERDQARTELASAHADALNRGAAVLDQLADAAEAKVLAHYNGACGTGSCDMVRESARTLREMAGTHTAPTA